MKKILLITTALLLLTVPLLVAQGNMGKGNNTPGQCNMSGKNMMMKGGRGGHGQGHVMGMGLMQCQELNLTDAQKDQMEQLSYDHQSRMIDLKAQVEKAQLDKRHAMNTDSPDKARVLSATREVSRIRGQIAEERVNNRFAMRDILTAEQLETLKSLDRPFMGPRGNRGHGGQPGQGNGPGPRGFAPEDDNSTPDEG